MVKAIATCLGSAERAHIRSIAIWRPEDMLDHPLEPVWVSEAVHQSGINCLDVQSVDSECFPLLRPLQSRRKVL